MDKLITDERLRQGAEEGMDGFLKVFTDAYLEVTGGELTAETMPRLTGSQHALLGYHFFHEEVMDGGFCQLIYNGYGPYIFDNPFAKAMRLWGCKEFSKVVYKAKEVYDEFKDDLTRERTDEEFMAMYMFCRITANRLQPVPNVRQNHIHLCAIWLHPMRHITTRFKTPYAYWQKKSARVQLQKHTNIHTMTQAWQNNEVA